MTVSNNMTEVSCTVVDPHLALGVIINKVFPAGFSEEDSLIIRTK